MKNITTIYLILFCQILLSQEQLKEIQIQTINDIDIPLLSVLKQKKDKPLVLFTWAKKWCNPCVKVLDKFDTYYYENLRENYDLKFVALNLDKGKDAEDIKKFVIDREWYFDIYKDPNSNYMNILNISSAPQIYLIVNNKIINYKSGFVDWENGTPKYINNMVKSIGSKKIYFDEKWNYTDSENAFFIRYTDYIDEQYEVQDRWISGEIQMRGTYKDKWLSEKEGKFNWYYKNGKLSTQRFYDSNKLDGKSSQWYDNGQLWLEEEYNDGKLMNILNLNSKNGDKLKKGNFSQGNGYIFRYDDEGNKKSRQEFKNGKLDGIYTVYNSDGKVESKHLYKEGIYIEKLE